jgi:hypothetical protein
VVSRGPHIYNFDNYCNCISSYIKSSEKGAFAACLWTGVTLKALTPATDIDLVEEADGSIVPAMPKSLYTKQLFDGLVGWMRKIDGEGEDYDTGSFGKKYKVRSCPPKPVVSDEMRRDDPLLAEAMSGKSKDGLHNVYPAEVINHNPGSNVGLGHVLRKVYRERGVEDGTSNKYILMVTDCNIYHRINKVHIYGCVCVRMKMKHW